MAFIFTFLEVIVISDLKKSSTDLAKKRHASADLHIPIHPLVYASVSVGLSENPRKFHSEQRPCNISRIIPHLTRSFTRVRTFERFHKYSIHDHTKSQDDMVFTRNIKRFLSASTSSH